MAQFQPAASVVSRPMQMANGVQPCRLLTAAGDFLASGVALVEADGSSGFMATVQSLEPVAPVLLAIFHSGDQRFQLDTPREGVLNVELTRSRWLDGGRRVCFFRSCTPPATIP